jgi:hypothetical protein
MMPEDVETSSGISARTTMVLFAGNAMMAQYKSKYGFSESWGGGFEVAYVADEGFKKIDNILVRCWSLNEGGELGNIGTSFLMHYQGSTLKLTSFGDREHTTVVRSPIKNSLEELSREKVIPEWTVDLFYRVEDGAHICTVQIEFPWSKTHSEFCFDGDDLVAWKMNKVRVDKIIKLIGQKKQTGEQFAVMTL